MAFPPGIANEMRRRRPRRENDAQLDGRTGEAPGRPPGTVEDADGRRDDRLAAVHRLDLLFVILLGMALTAGGLRIRTVARVR